MRAQSRLSAAASGDGAFLSIPGFVGLTEVGWKGTRISLVGYPTAPGPLLQRRETRRPSPP